jgi:hypothetical protein
MSNFFPRHPAYFGRRDGKLIAFCVPKFFVNSTKFWLLFITPFRIFGAAMPPGATKDDRNLVLYQARGAHRRQLVSGLPFRNKLDGGKSSCI